jgi:hypothetical protein
MKRKETPRSKCLHWNVSKERHFKKRNYRTISISLENEYKNSQQSLAAKVYGPTGLLIQKGQRIRKAKYNAAKWIYRKLQKNTGNR